MRNLRSVGCLAVTAAVLLVGCGKSDSKSSPLDLKSFVAKGADVVCSSFEKCSCTDGSAAASCKEAFTAQATHQLDYQLLWYPGQTIDPVAAQTCLNDLKVELSDCAMPPVSNDEMDAKGGPSTGGLDFVPSCQNLFKGVQTEGERCDSDSECAAGLACDYADGTYVCVKAAAKDEDCNGLSCGEGLWCDYSGDRICNSLLEKGVSCDLDRTDQCQAGLECLPSYELEDYICAAPTPVGESCEDMRVCVPEAYCGTDDTCVAKLADGKDCDYSGQCLHDWCNSDSKCENWGICYILND